MNGSQDRRDLDAAFLREVVGAPHDDTPLLIYADWLMDQPDAASQTRGEYLRLSSLLARTNDRGLARDLRWRTQELWWGHADAWLGPVYDAVDHFIYERGRLCVEVSEGPFCRLSPEELACVPAWDWVTDVVVRKGGLDLLLHLGRSPRPPLLEGVDVGRGSLEEGELEYLLEEGFWAGVPELELQLNPLGDSGAAGLAYWPGLAGVRLLDLTGCGIGRAGLLSLAQSPYLDAVEKLRLTAPAYESEGWRLLNQRFGRRVRWS